MIKEITINNYKSLRNVHFKPESLNVLVGPNASGKSNFVECLDFISKIYKYGLQNAVNEKEGFHNICFKRQRRSKGSVYIKVVFELIAPQQKRNVKHLITSEFEMKALSEKLATDFEVTMEKYTVTGESNNRIFKMERTGNRVNAESFDDEKIKKEVLDFLVDHLKPVSTDDIIAPYIERRLFPDVRMGLGQLSTYHFLRNNCAMPLPYSRLSKLGYHGEHIASVVQNLEKNLPGNVILERVKEKLRLAVPVMKDVAVKKYDFGANLGLWFRESNEANWEAKQVSEGTLMFFTTLISVMDPLASVVAIDEPENSIHPWMLGVLMDTCREEISNRQIFLTTHSPVLLDEANFEEIFIVSRNPNGETQIKSASTEYPEFKDLQKEYGQLWLNGVMGGVPSAEQLEFEFERG